jgi:hypothetical protein
MHRLRTRRDAFSTFKVSLRGVDSLVMVSTVSRKERWWGMAPEWVARG